MRNRPPKNILCHARTAHTTRKKSVALGNPPPRSPRGGAAVFSAFAILPAVAGAGSACGAVMPKAGETLPPWADGFFDIHHINTGKGESAFYVFGSSLF